MMKYKGYHAEVTYDHEAAVFHGEVVGTRDVIFFEGTSVDQLNDGVPLLDRRLPGSLRRKGP